MWSKLPSEYASINEFFMRRYKAYSFGDMDLLCPATSVVKKYPTISQMDCLVKGAHYTLEKCGIPNSRDYENQACYYFYLSPADYHCFHSPMDGTIDQIVDHTQETGPRKGYCRHFGRLFVLYRCAKT